MTKFCWPDTFPDAIYMLSIFAVKIDLFKSLHVLHETYNCSVFDQGGILILEPQPWESYKKNFRVSEVKHLPYFKLL